MSKVTRILIGVLFAVMALNSAYLGNVVYDLQNRVAQNDAYDSMLGANFCGLASYVMPPTGMLTVACKSVVNITVTENNTIDLRTGKPVSYGGTGMIVGDGVILTAKHIVTKLDDPGVSAVVKFNDGVVSLIVSWAGDPSSELAVVKVDADTPFVVDFVTPGGLKVGDAAWAIGCPYGLSWSVSAGIISRMYEFDPQFGTIQVDASINPGNSGCPVFDRSGRVIGMAFAAYLNSGIGFVVGVDRIIEVLPGLIEQVNQ